MDISVIIRHITASYGLLYKKEKYISLGGKMLNFKSSSKLLIYILLYFMDLRKTNQLLSINSDILSVLRF